MDLNELENRLKDSSQRQEEQVDTNALWSDVQKELSKEKKRRLLFTCMMLGMMAIAGSVMLYNANGDNDSDDLLEDALTQKKNEMAKASIVELPTSNAVESVIPLNSIGSRDIKTSNSVSSNTEEAIPSIEESIPNEEITNANSPLSKLNNKSNKSELTGLNINTTRSQKQEQKISIVDFKASELSYIQEVRNGMLVEKEGNGLLSHQFTKFDHSQTEASISNILYSDQKSLAGLKIATNIPMVPSSIRYVDLGLNAHLPEIVPFAPSTFLSNRTTATWNIGLTGGLSFNNVVLSPTNDDIRDMSYTTRSESLSTLASWTASLNIGRRISDYLWIGTGLEVNSILNKSTKQLMFQEEILMDGVVVEHVIGPNGTTDIIGQAIVTQETISLRSRISKSYELSVPLMLQLELPSGRLRPFAALGVDYSLLLGRSGLIHLNSSEEYDIGEDQEFLMKRSLGLSARVQAGAKVQLSETLRLSTLVGYRKSFYSHFRQASGISEKYSSIRLQLGLEHQF